MGNPEDLQPTGELNRPEEGRTQDLPRDGGQGAGAAADATRPTDRAPGMQRAGDTVGPYKLVSRLGEGGFGEVWMAERREPFVQRVALKLIKPGMDSRAVIARFEQERQALAVMNHPHIAKVLDGGLTKEGRPYFAMEYVKGEPITEFCDARKLGVKARLELFAQACEAVQHAHLKGIVHRDIKPSNILAYEVEGEGPKLKVIDFGVAKAMSQPLTDKTIFTETGQMIGTPAYMSPEQADPTASDIDTRSDIYSLGVLLYELIAGATPFDAKTLRAKAYGEIQRIIREDDPPTPSARLSTISTKDAELASRIEKARGVALKELARELKSELEWIPLKAMRKEPAKRYQTAIAFAEDIRAYLDGRPITAAPESVLYLARKALSRHQTAFAAVVTAVMSTTAAIAGGVLSLRRLADGSIDSEFVFGLYLAYLPALVGVGFLSQRLTAQPSVSEPLWRGLVVFPATVLIVGPVWEFLPYEAFDESLSSEPYEAFHCSFFGLVALGVYVLRTRLFGLPAGLALLRAATEVAILLAMAGLAFGGLVVGMFLLGIEPS